MKIVFRSIDDLEGLIDRFTPLWPDHDLNRECHARAAARHPDL
jgi:hypothetical protein